MIKELYIAVRAEMLKFKRTNALALATIAPLLISGLFFCILFFKADKMVKPGTNGLATMLDGSISSASYMLFPFFLILLTILIHQVEHRAGSLKDLFSYPVSYFSSYTSKWIVSFMLIGLSLILYIGFSLLGAWVLSIKHPTLIWFDSTLFLLFMKQVVIVAFASLLIMGIQFLVALRWSNAIVGFGVGVVGFISAVVLLNGWEYVHYHPYATSALSYMRITGGGRGTLMQLLSYNAIGLVCLYICGYYMWCKRRIV
jgi:hypothetical protein